MPAICPPRRCVRRRSRVGACAAAWCVAAAAVAADAPVWKFSVGMEEHYRMSQDMTLAMDMGPAGKMNTVVKQQIDMTWRVLEVSESGVAKLTQKIDRMRMQMTAPGGNEIAFDSSSSEPPTGFAAMLAPVMKELTKTAFEVSMSPRGEVLDVAIPEDLLKALKNSPGAAMMGDLTSREGLKQMVEKGSLTLPEQLEAGQQWSTEVQLKNPVFGTQTVATTYTYVGSRDVDGATLDVFQPTLSMRFGDAAAGNGAKIEIADQKSTGEVLFNRTAGRLESSAIDMEMDMNISVGGRDIQQAIDQKVRMRRISLEELEREAAAAQAAAAAAQPADAVPADANPAATEPAATEPADEAESGDAPAAEAPREPAAN